MLGISADMVDLAMTLTTTGEIARLIQALHPLVAIPPNSLHISGEAAKQTLAEGSVQGFPSKSHEGTSCYRRC